ncbi:hypothetical protein JX265_008667 [Neoarthrinium moseri]|uniref:CAP-Gly domain-containing protein n=1 Tax=Neoarthrinium moseri TaxID=1658444 RepID=A0A9P9WI07_9PEZI|nr:uncharacterized protein JN550_013534 [Neoarthrinium moseri]KAI1856968.1 hypothetical protein JN550_013534 [Neoarthrinium moseri]KAI1864296.1 hypothetical protein JX265_008667 [Neoarthrinium moseri]
MTDIEIGERRSYDGAICTVRYVGEVAGTSGSWIGVEWDDATRGKHDGSHKGTRYFSCKSKSPTAASFVRPSRTAEPARSFIAALRDKYTGDVSAASAHIRFSGKIAEEVGFEKIRRKQAELAELKFVILDGSRVAFPYAEGDEPIAQTCPKVIQLELSRNLFTKLGIVVQICSELPELRNLRLNGNRFQRILQDDGLENAPSVFKDVRDLGLEETLLSWEELCHVASKFPALATLSADANQLSSLPVTPLLSLSSTLLSLNLEFNEFIAFSDIRSLSGLKALRNLHLKGNNICSITSDSSGNPPVFPSSLQYLDISYNKVSSWSFVDGLPDSFPGLTHLRFTHNPVYDNPDPDHSAQSKTITEEAYMITVGRLAGLKVLNFGTITNNDRQDAEMFYLARIGKHLAATARIPKSFDIYRVKGIAGKLFAQDPLSLRLIWETGEWDPVAGFDDEVEDSSDEEDLREPDTDTPDATSQSGKRAGRWVKREAELQDGPRQLGFCVDGLEAKVRVEIRKDAL